MDIAKYRDEPLQIPQICICDIMKMKPMKRHNWMSKKRDDFFKVFTSVNNQYNYYYKV